MIYALVIVVSTVLGSHHTFTAKTKFPDIESCASYGSDVKQVLEDSNYVIGVKVQCVLRDRNRRRVPIVVEPKLPLYNQDDDGRLR